MEFNKEQLEAIQTIEGPLLLLAGAGAGKTRVITNRISYMIKEKKIPADQILAVTFTAKAAAEMKERAEQLIEGKVEISTFHSFGIKQIKEYLNYLELKENFSIYGSYEQLNIINVILTKNKYIIEEKPYEIISFISKFKEKNKTREDFSNPIIFDKIFKEYNKILKENNAMDFSDILVNLNKILDIPELLEEIQENFKYIMIDEYQDTNNIQYEIINKIAKKYRNICVVGDENQSIYGFRGANIQNILNFSKDYPETKIISLPINYRSTKTIVEASNHLIMNNKERMDKKIISLNEVGPKINYNVYYSEMEQAENVVKQIKENIKNDNYDNAILYRVNKQSRIFEEMLSKYNIKYIVKNGGKFYERKEIKILVDLLKTISNSDDLYSFLSIVNIPNKIVSINVLEKIKNLDKSKNFYENLDCVLKNNKIILNKFVFETLKKQLIMVNALKQEETISDLLLRYCNAFYFNYIKQSTLEFEDKIQNIQEFIDSVKIFEAESKTELLEKINLFLEKIEQMTTSDENSQNSVKLMTIHSSKGLEFDSVFIVGFEEGQIPVNLQENEKKIEEERRLFYVALTRAKKNIYLSRSLKKIISDKLIEIKESRFLKEIPKKFIKCEDEKENKSTNVKKINTNLFNEKAILKIGIKVGDKVFHEEYGVGIVENLKKEVKVIFKEANVKFDTEIAERELKKIN